MGQAPASNIVEDLTEGLLPFLQGTAEFGEKHPFPKQGCSSPSKVAKVGNLLVSVRAPVGELNIADQDYGIGRGLCAVEFLELDPRFGWWAIHHQRRQLNEVSTGSTYEAVSASDVRNIVVPTPTFSEQRRIANYLERETSQIDTLIKEKEWMLALLEEKRAALISRAVTRGLNQDIPFRISGIPWIQQIPGHWKVRRSKYLFEQASIPVQDGEEIVTCFRDGQVTLRRNRREDGFTKAVLELGYQGIREGQLVLHSMDAFAGAIGVSDSNGKCSPEYIICDPINSGVISTYYAKLLRVMALRGYILAACPAVRERAPRIRFSHFSNMMLPVPPRDEQEQIVAAIAEEREQTSEMEAALNQSVELLKERRSALITAAVTGQLDIAGEAA